MSLARAAWAYPAGLCKIRAHKVKEAYASRHDHVVQRTPDLFLSASPWLCWSPKAMVADLFWNTALGSAGPQGQGGSALW